MKVSAFEEPQGLGLPFAVVGLGGGWLAGDFFRAGCYAHDESMRANLLFLTPIAAGALGLFLSTGGSKWPLWKALFACIVGVLAASLCSGFFVGVVGWRADGAAMGASNGLATGLAFLPALCILVIAARRVGRARPGTIMDASDRAAIWLAVATSLGVGSLAALPGWVDFPTCNDAQSSGALMISVAAMAVIGLIAVLDARRYAQAREAARKQLRMQPRDPDAPVPFGTPSIDVGVGDMATEQLGGTSAIYREQARAVRIVEGDAVLARRSLGRACLLAVACLGLTTIAVTAQLLQPTTPLAPSMTHCGLSQQDQ